MPTTLTIIIFSVLTLIFTIWFANIIIQEITGGLSSDFSDWFIGSSLSLMMSILLCGTSLCLFISFLTPSKYLILDKTETQELVQASTDSKIEGVFYFRRGIIGTNDVYEYYYRDGNKIRKNYLYANSPNTYIVETTETPHVELIVRTRCEDWGWWRKNFLKEENRYEDHHHIGIIYVPEGTIIPDKYDGLNM